MKKNTEILLNMLFWIISAWLIIQIFGVEAVEIELVEDIDINEIMIDGTKTEKQIQTTSYITRDQTFTYKQLAGIGFKALLFYLNLFIFLPNFFQADKDRKLNNPPLEEEKGKGQSGIWKLVAKFNSAKTQLMLFILATLILCFITEVTIVSLAFDQPINEFKSGHNLSFYFFYLVISLSYGFIKDWYRSENLNIQLKEEKLNTELNFLKSQINPHFLFNILNNLYSLSAQTDKPELSTGISELSHLMRYMIYDSNVEKIAIEKEVTFLRNMINLNNLSYSEEDEIDISFEVKGLNNAHKIAPVILIPFVENAFKHGIDIDKKSFIQIFLEIKNNIMEFEVVNSMHNNSNPISKTHSGIGLENVRKRLNLIYPEKHKLEISESEKDFKIHLTLMIN